MIIHNVFVNLDFLIIKEKNNVIDVTLYVILVNNKQFVLLV